MKVIGIQRNVTFKMENNTFSGINIFCAVERDGVEGFATEKIFVNTTKDCFKVAVNLNLHDEINCYYNRYGKIDAIVPVKK